MLNHFCFAAHANIQAVIVAIFAFYVEFGEIVLAEDFRQCLDKGHIGVMSSVFFCHHVLRYWLRGLRSVRIWGLIGEVSGREKPHICPHV